LDEVGHLRIQKKDDLTHPPGILFVQARIPLIPIAEYEFFHPLSIQLAFELTYARMAWYNNKNQGNAA
jgi:hypothetical protein